MRAANHSFFDRRRKPRSSRWCSEEVSKNSLHYLTPPPESYRRVV
ncbi:hypothetical protein D187_001358 [Cystobacter fuscus DSM 2262]|uniref:Uncharacterized protein n=1 Tax=Cystobacter fuscus (strain ATCC 25194 / DSM 2262 / NBRC 100088 / M29) TaxID=1242864 RepID=S9QHG1_CYSF2|nr:hypothetical protein D187_001358 [Cystobacter fuscus DSM 2262]